MSISAELDKKHLAKFRKVLADIPPAAKRTTSLAVERKAKELVSLMQSIVPVREGVLRQSIRYRPLEQGMKAIVWAGRRKGGKVGKNVEFGRRKVGMVDAQPFFVPTVKLQRDKINASIRRSLSKAVKKAAAGG